MFNSLRLNGVKCVDYLIILSDATEFEYIHGFSTRHLIPDENSASTKARLISQSMKSYYHLATRGMSNPLGK
uniref:NYN domain-containing protein n=1 Tax=Haemonchus contortus TaxID=6289 RepID=A0A7I4Z4D1_HAECO